MSGNMSKWEKKSKIHSVMFHHFHDNNTFQPSQGSISAQELKELIQYYQTKGYEFLKAREWYLKAVSNELEENQVAITFDDGLRCQVEIAAKVLEDLGLTGFFFVPSLRFEGKMEYLELFRDFRYSKFKRVEEFYELFFECLRSSYLYQSHSIEEKLKQVDFNDFLKEYAFYSYEDKVFRYVRDNILTEEEYNGLMLGIMKQHGYDLEINFHRLYMNKEDLNRLSQKGHIIGLHSHSHYTNLKGISYQRQKMEYIENKEILENIVNTTINVAAYPCNSYNQDTLDIMKELGVRLAFCANMEKSCMGLLEIPRCDHATIVKEMIENGRK